MIRKAAFSKFYLLFGVVMLVASCAPVSPGNQQTMMTPAAFITHSVFFFLMVLLVYQMLVLNPSRQRQADQTKFIKELKKNDEVMTSGGVFGRVVAIKPEYITIEIARGVQIKVEPQYLHVPPKKVDGKEPVDEDKSSTEKKS